MYYLCSENKGADQLRSYLCFHKGKNQVFLCLGSFEIHCKFGNFHVTLFHVVFFFFNFRVIHEFLNSRTSMLVVFMANGDSLFNSEYFEFVREQIHQNYVLTNISELTVYIMLYSNNDYLNFVIQLSYCLSE